MKWKVYVNVIIGIERTVEAEDERTAERIIERLLQSGERGVTKEELQERFESDGEWYEVLIGETEADV